jgi:hypothetical protein
MDVRMTATPQTGAETEFLGYLMRGADLLRAGQLEDARQVIDQALGLQPGEPRARNLLGLVHFRLGQLDDSRGVYESLCTDFPSDTGFRLNLGLVQLRIGEIDAAITELERVVADEPENQRAHGYLGLAYAQVGDAARARDAFLKAGQPELAKEMAQRLQAAAPPAGGEPPAGLEPGGGPGEFEEERTAIAPDDVLERAVQASSVPDEEDVDAAFDEMERGSGQHEAPKRRTTDVGPGPRLGPPADAPAPGATPAPETAPAAPAPAEPPPAAPATFDLRALTEVCRACAADLAPAAPHEAEAAQVAATPSADPPVTPVAAFVTRGLLYPGGSGAGLAVGPSGALLCRIDGAMILRLGGGAAVTGDLELEPAYRRERGRNLDEPLGGADAFSVARGRGAVLALPPPGGRFVALALEDDIVYVREDAVFGFTEEVHWETGRIPGLATAFPMLQFRGRGALALRLGGTLTPVKLEQGQTMGVDAAVLFGWVGRVVPHAMTAARGAGRAVGCTGEGVLLLESQPESPR